MPGDAVRRFISTKTATVAHVSARLRLHKPHIMPRDGLKMQPIARLPAAPGQTAADRPGLAAAHTLHLHEFRKPTALLLACMRLLHAQEMQTNSFDCAARIANTYLDAYPLPMRRGQRF